jgi:hypothetical protein
MRYNYVLEAIKMNKTTAWDFALGSIKAAGLKPTPEFLAMVKKETAGEMTLADKK